MKAMQMLQNRLKIRLRRELVRAACSEHVRAVSDGILPSAPTVSTTVSMLSATKCFAKASEPNGRADGAVAPGQGARTNSTNFFD